jgi:formylglycine-generating enzyme required for sulfatase activity
VVETIQGIERAQPTLEVKMALPLAIPVYDTPARGLPDATLATAPLSQRQPAAPERGRRLVLSAIIGGLAVAAAAVAMMVLLPGNGKESKLATTEPLATRPGSGTEKWVNSVGIKLVPIAAGEFTMGASADEIERFKAQMWSVEGPQHRVKITKPFWMAAEPVTVGQFRQFVRATSYRPEGSNADAQSWHKPGFIQTDEHTVVYVSWNDAVAFCNWLNTKKEEQGRKYRLPTEAEWEYCCRAGSTTLYYFGDDPGQLGKYAWFAGNANNASHPVGQLKPNAWGLHDMHGNVWQWTADWYAADYYKNSPKEDPLGPSPTKGPGLKPAKVLRGGSYWAEAASCRSASRKERQADYSTPHSGFRVVCER